MTLHEKVEAGRADGARPAESAGSPGEFFPPLHSAPGMPLAQDRWERIVSGVTVPYAVDDVWAALVDVDAVAQWLAVCRGGWGVAGEESMLDFEDGEFFYCSTQSVRPPDDSHRGELTYQWRWVGIGPATTVNWVVMGIDESTTTVTVTEEATNPPSDWRSWNGMGWPGILEQLASHLRTRTNWRWPWRRMGPYVQIELPAPPFQAWEALTDAGAIKHWLQRSTGSLSPGEPMRLTMGDASGTIVLEGRRLVDAGQEFPSYLPYLEFTLQRGSWERPLGGRLWVEPAGLGRTLLQVFVFDWEGLDLADPLEERRILTSFWVSAFGRAQMLFMAGAEPPGPHGWST